MGHIGMFRLGHSTRDEDQAPSEDCCEYKRLRSKRVNSLHLQRIQNLIDSLGTRGWLGCWMGRNKVWRIEIVGQLQDILAYQSLKDEKKCEQLIMVVLSTRCGIQALSQDWGWCRGYMLKWETHQVMLEHKLCQLNLVQKMDMALSMKGYYLVERRNVFLNIVAQRTHKSKIYK